MYYPVIKYHTQIWWSHHCYNVFGGGIGSSVNLNSSVLASPGEVVKTPMTGPRQWNQNFQGLYVFFRAHSSSLRCFWRQCKLTLLFLTFVSVFCFISVLTGLLDISSPTRDWTHTARQWKGGGLTTGSPGNSPRMTLSKGKLGLLTKIRNLNALWPPVICLRIYSADMLVHVCKDSIKIFITA